MTQPYNPQQPGQYQQPVPAPSQYPASQYLAFQYTADQAAQYPATGGYPAVPAPATGQFQNFPQTGPTPMTPRQRPPRSKAVIVLTVLAVLLLAGAGAFGSLYFSERSDHQATSDQLGSTQRDLAEARTNAQSSNTDLENTKTRLTQANQDKVAAQNAASKDTACATAARKVLTAVAAKNDAAANTAISEMVDAC